MQYSPVVVCLPIADRQRSFAFYRDALELDPLGEPAEDGLPEPLQFVLNAGLRIMLIPTGGFGWVIGDREVTQPGRSECIFSLSAEAATDVDDLVKRAVDAGAEIVTDPSQRPWGYTGTFTDPDGHLWQVSSEQLPS